MYEYSQSHLPVREQTKVVGHAVRAMYMYAAMADLAAEHGDAALKAACETLWADVIERRMYVTGGFGPSEHNEGFTADYDLPNDTAYCETCASVAMVFWAARMLNLDLDGQYADLLEPSSPPASACRRCCRQVAMRPAACGACSVGLFQ